MPSSEAIAGREIEVRSPLREILLIRSVKGLFPGRKIQGRRESEPTLPQAGWRGNRGYVGEGEGEEEIHRRGNQLFDVLVVPMLSHFHRALQSCDGFRFRCLTWSEKKREKGEGKLPRRRMKREAR